MEVSKPKRLSIKKYQQEKCDRLTIDVPKGKRNAYKLIAAELGLSLSLLVQNGVENYAVNHGCKEVVPEKPASVQPSAEEKRLLQNLASLPKSTRAKFVSLLEEVAKLAEQKGADSNGDSGRTD